MGCDPLEYVVKHIVKISIHASRMGCDKSRAIQVRQILDFNPRIPYGMRQARTCARCSPCQFQSTHPVWDATFISHSAAIKPHDFNPRIPYGMRRGQYTVKNLNDTFQSTHPVWDATGRQICAQADRAISIHASRMGCD